MNFDQQFSAVRWKRVGLTALTGVVLVLALSTAYDAWKRRDGWCIRFYPDGTEQTLYGRDCQK